MIVLIKPRILGTQSLLPAAPYHNLNKTHLKSSYFILNLVEASIFTNMDNLVKPNYSLCVSLELLTYAGELKSPKLRVTLGAGNHFAENLSH